MTRGNVSINANRRVPTGKPPFSIAKLRKAIPEHCFKRSLTISCAYLAADLLLVAVLFGLSQLVEARAPWWLAVIFWPAYWFFQGAVGFGLWIVGHECGHQAFSEFQLVNDAVGLVVHSFLLLPYFSWKHSHRQHHSSTGNLEKDQAHVPSHLEEAVEETGLKLSAPLRVAHIAFYLTLGLPLYLIMNAAGRDYGTFVNHFDPYSPIFSKRERTEIVISDAGLIAVLSGLGMLAQSYGWLWVVKVYVIPYLIVDYWLVIVTLLQHTHPGIPHYKDKDWDWLRGALATVDRSFGFLDHFFHHIADTHVAHHLFSTIPFYHAEEATEAIKPILGEYYMYDAREVHAALWEDWNKTAYCAPDKKGEPALWFRGK